MRTLVALLTIAVLTVVDQTNGLSCRGCEDVVCRDTDDCKYGLTKSVCLCCDVCAKGPGEKCGGMWGIAGNCGEGYTCSNSDYYGQSGICTEDPHVSSGVRGSDGSKAKRAIRRPGTAQLIPRKHQHVVSGGIPPEYAALLKQYRKRKQG